MQHNPHLQQLHDYDKCIKTKTIHPKFFYTECCRCGMAFVKEPIYRLSYHPFEIFSNRFRTIYGCQHCFSSEQDFHKYAQNKGYIMPDDVHQFVEDYLSKPNYQHTLEDIKKYLSITLSY